MRPELPQTLRIDLTADQSNDVRLMVSDLENNIISGLILVLAVIFFFIGGQSAVFVALAIPYSMFITFSLLTGFDVTLNMVVLFSLILALGMLVDNGIVIVENIYRHMQQGKSREEAARMGTDQVAWPVITSTLTTLGAFSPMLFWPGIMGQFMGYLPQTLIMALSASLALCISAASLATAGSNRSNKPNLSLRSSECPMIDQVQPRFVAAAAGRFVVKAPKLPPLTISSRNTP